MDSLSMSHLFSAQQKESVSPMTVASKGSDSKYNRPGSGSRPNSSDSAAAIDGSDRIGPGKSGRHHHFGEDKSESMTRRSHDRDRGLDLEYSDERGRERRERGRDNRETRDRGEDSDRGRDSSTERTSRHREDHRIRNDRSELSSHEATASARMHGHISRGDGNDERYNVCRFFSQPTNILTTGAIASRSPPITSLKQGE